MVIGDDFYLECVCILYMYIRLGYKYLVCEI